MSLPQPTTEQERWMVVASRLPKHRYAPLLAERMGGWRSASLLTRIAFFVLGLVAATMTTSIIWLLHLPQPLLISGLLLSAIAEWLIAARRLYKAGIEEALLIAGLMLLAFAAIDGLKGNDTAIALAITVAFALGGGRLRNPLFTTLAASASSVTVALVCDERSLLWSASSSIYASLYCYASAIGALWFGTHVFKRPSYDRMLDWLVVTMPVIGYGWAAQGSLFSSGVDYLQQPLRSMQVLLAPLLITGLALALGLRRRTHAPLLSCMACIACVAYELRALSGWSVTERLIIWGCLTLVGSVVLDRWLRTPWRGITSKRIDDQDDPLELLQLAGAALATPRQPLPQQNSFESGDGKFGGGGASGRF